MLKSVKILRLALAALIAGILVLGTLVVLGSTASAATTRTLSISARPAAALVGKSVTFSGVLSRSPKGSKVSVQRKVGTSWVTAKTVGTSTAGGKYAARVTLPSKAGTYSYRALAAAGGAKAVVSATVKVSALTPVAATLRVVGKSPVTVTAGSAVTVTGTVKPFVTGTTVTIQRFGKSTWVSTGFTARVTSKGTYTRSVVVKDGSVFRVFVPRVGLKASAVSPVAANCVVIANPKISTTSLPDGNRNVAYSAQLTQVGANPGTWSVAPGLPAGLKLNSDTGRITGTPTGTSNASYTFRFAQPGLTTASKVLNLTVTVPVPPTIATTSLPTGQQGVAYTTTLTAQGNPAGTWTAAPLPAGLTRTGNTISGTPTTPGTTQVVIGFTQTSTGLAATPKTLDLVVTPPAPVISTSSLPAGQQGVAYTATLTAEGDPAGTWTAAPLPAGLTRTGNTISGTPTTPGTTQVVIGFTQTSTGLAATPKTLDLVIAPPPPAPVISTTSLPNASFFQAYSTQVTAVGNPTGTWTATIQKRGSGSANDGGFSMSSSGVLSNGLVLQTGVYDVTLNFTATGNPTPATPVVLTLTVT